MHDQREPDPWIIIDDIEDAPPEPVAGQAPTPADPASGRPGSPAPQDGADGWDSFAPTPPWRAAAEQANEPVRDGEGDLLDDLLGDPPGAGSGGRQGPTVRLPRFRFRVWLFFGSFSLGPHAAPRIVTLVVSCLAVALAIASIAWHPQPPPLPLP